MSRDYDAPLPLPAGVQPGAYGNFYDDGTGNLASLVAQYGPTPFGTAGMPLITEEYGNHGEGGRFKESFDPAAAIVNLPDGKYARVGTANVTDIIANVPGTRYDPTYGYIAPYEAFEKWSVANRGQDDFFDKFGPLLALGIGGLVASPALFGAGASMTGAGATTAAAGAPAGAGGLLEGLSLEGALGGTSGVGLTSGGGLGLSTTAGGLGLGAGPVSAATLGAGAAGGGILETIAQIANSVPPGTTQAVQAATQGGGQAAAATGAAATGAATTVGGTVGDGLTGFDPIDLGQAPGNYSPAGAASGLAGAANTGTNMWEQLLQSIGLPASLAGSIPQIAGALTSYFSNKDAAGNYTDAAAQAAALSDPFASQRGFYQGVLKNSYTDPNFFNNNAAFTGIRDQALNATQARMASQGYSGSGNMLAELAKVATNEGYKFAQPWQAQVAQNAGAGISPGYAGYLSQQGANQAQQANMRSTDALTNFATQLFKGLA